jgi:hypothetical protein
MHTPGEADGRRLMLMDRQRRSLLCPIWAMIFLVACGGRAALAQEPDAAALIRDIDAAVKARYENVVGFTDIEHYSVFRGADETHPVAEMTVKDTYRKDVGKTYTVLSESGSGFVMKIGLNPFLENEKVVNQPGNLQKSWFTSANYEMKFDGQDQMNGRDCLHFDVKARQKATNSIDGSIWVDAKDYTLVQIDGVATKSPSAFAGATHMMRQYVEVQGNSMAAHARAESASIVGRIVVTIDYSDYQLQLR